MGQTLESILGWTLDSGQGLEPSLDSGQGPGPTVFSFSFSFFWAEVKEIAAVIIGLESKSAGGLDSGAAGKPDSVAGVSGLRTEKELGTEDWKRDADLSTDRTD